MQNLQSQAQKDLRSIVDRIERLAEEQKGLAEDMKGIYLEAKSRGYDVKALRKVIALRKLDKAEREELDALVSTYLGALEGTPLGNYAKRQADELETAA